MGGEYEYLALLHQLEHPLLRLCRETGVPGTHDFVEQQNLRIDAGRNGKCQTDEHARRIGTHRIGKELPELRKVSDFIQLLFDLARGHTQQQAANANVVPAGLIHLKAGRELEHRTNMSLPFHVAGCRRINAGQDLQKSALTSSVESYKSNALTFADIQVDIFEGFHTITPRRRGSLHKPCKQPGLQAVCAVDAPLESHPYFA